MADGPDLTAGIADSILVEGTPLLGFVGEDQVVLVRDGANVHALGAICSHYGGPLVEGTVFDGAIHCPWHHACFDLKTGHAHGPALASIACYDVAVTDGKIRVRGKRDAETIKLTQEPARVVIVGGGPAGVACAEALRTEGHTGGITLVTGEDSDPVDRPNLSKDYLAGAAPEEWVYLRTADALAENKIELVRAQATAVDTKAKTVTAGGTAIGYDALLLATGAQPVRLPIDGAEHARSLRTLADSKAIAAAATKGGRAVVIGASFIGLEVAASLTARGMHVTVVGPEAVPLARVLGDEVGTFVRSVHEGKGVAFQLGRKPARINPDRVVLDDGTELPASLVVMGVGVQPRLELAQAAGLAIDRGVVVDDELRAAPGVWAAGDIARHRGMRIEHWQVATRHGQAVARSMLGKAASRFVPFFWTQHHDVTLGYVGHAEQFDTPIVRGSLAAKDAHVIYKSGGEVKAVVTIGRDRVALDAEAALLRGDRAALEAL